MMADSEIVVDRPSAAYQGTMGLESTILLGPLLATYWKNLQHVFNELLSELLLTGSS